MYGEDIKDNDIITLGIVNPLNNDKIHQRNYVFDIGGVCCTCTSTMYKDAPRVMVVINDE